MLATGVTLAGASPGAFLPDVTGEMIHAALLREVEYLRREITDPAGKWRRRTFYRAYAVLTLCRILYTDRKGAVVSKPRAAAWALRALPDAWYSLIREAMASDDGKPASLPLSRIMRLIEFTERQLASHVPFDPGRSAERPRNRGQAQPQP